MPPFLLAALPSLLELIPKLGNIFKSGSEVSERNVKAVEVVVEAAKAAIGATNEQDLVEKIKADPAAAATVKAAVESKWLEITEAGGGGIEGARKADAQFTVHGAPGFWLSPAFWITMALLPLVYMALSAVLFSNGFSDDMKAMVLGAIFGGLLTGGITSYWFGTTAGSQRKTELAAGKD